MKKFMAILAIAGVMTSCNSKKDEKKEEVKTEDTATKSSTEPTAPTTDPAPTGDVPKFADAEVQKFVDDYTAFVKSYIDAYKSKDMTKVSELAGKMQEWSGRTASVGQKLASSPDEAKKFNDYMVKLSQDWANAAKAMTP